MDKRKRIAVGSDHRGVELKTEMIKFLQAQNCVVTDLGTHSSDPVDYPDYAIKVAQAVANQKVDLGVVIFHSGIGVSVSANKVKGVRAALCQTVDQAELARKHTDANVLALPAGFVTPPLAKQIVAKWLGTSFEGGRHEKRIGKIKTYEEETS